MGCFAFVTNTMILEQGTLAVSKVFGIHPFFQKGVVGCGATPRGYAASLFAGLALRSKAMSYFSLLRLFSQEKKRANNYRETYRFCMPTFFFDTTWRRSIASRNSRKKVWIKKLRNKTNGLFCSNTKKHPLGCFFHIKTTPASCSVALQG